VATTRTRSRESGLKGPLGRQVVAGHRNETNRSDDSCGETLLLRCFVDVLGF